MPAKKKRRIDIDDLFRLRVVTDATMSPDGGRIVFALSRQDLKKNKTFSSLYTIPSKGGRLRRLTRGDHADGAPRFSPDGRTLAFLSNRDKTSAVWLLPMEGGEAERMTDRDGNVLDYAWSPDGKSIAVARRALTERERLLRDGKNEEAGRLPDFRHVTRLFYKLDGQGFLTGEHAHIHLVRVAGGRSVQVTDGKFDDYEPRFSPDGGRISFLSNRVPDPDRFLDNMDVYTVGADGKGLRRVTRERGLKQGHTWSPDGKVIVYVGHLGGPGEWDAHNMHVRRVAAGGGKSVDLTPDLDRHASNLVIGDTASTSFGGPAPAFTDGGRTVIFGLTDEGAAHLASVPVTGGAIEPVVTGPVTVFGFGLPAGGGSGWAVAGDLTNPADLYRLDAETGLGKRLTSVNRAALAPVDVVTPEEVRFRRRGGQVHGWLLKPPGFREGRKYPFVLEIHGGPHVAYGHVFVHEMQLLAARGYVVLMVNPRGSAGYGLDHRAAIHADWGNLDTKDLMRAVDGVVSRGIVDERRMYVTGGSYGGYMTNWLVGHTKRFRAAVTQRSVVNMTSFFASSDIGFVFEQEFDGAPWEAEERYRHLSPLTYAGRIETPLLIIHSEEDHRCPIAQGEELFVTLKHLGREVEMVRFVGESHGLSRGGRPQNRAERLRRILDWFRRHGGK